MHSRSTGRQPEANPHSPCRSLHFCPKINKSPVVPFIKSPNTAAAFGRDCSQWAVAWPHYEANRLVYAWIPHGPLSRVPGARKGPRHPGKLSGFSCLLTIENSLLWVWAFLLQYLICFPLYNLALNMSLLLAQQFQGHRPIAPWKGFIASAIVLFILWFQHCHLPPEILQLSFPLPMSNWFWLSSFPYTSIFLACHHLMSRSTCKP